MAFVLKDRVREYTDTNGTGAIRVTGARSGYRRFNESLSNGDTTLVCVKNGAGQWQTFLATWNSATQTLARTTAYESSQGAGVTIDFSGESQEVWINYPAQWYHTPQFQTLIVNGTSTLGNGLANYLTVAGAAASARPTITAVGSDTNISINIVPKGSGVMAVVGGANIGGTANLSSTSANYLTVAGSASSTGPTLTATGSSTNISIGVLPKGTGRFVVTGNGDFGGISTSYLPGSALAALVGTSTGGYSGVRGVSRTEDNSVAGSQSCIGISGFAFNSNVSQLQSAYAAYFEAQKYAGASTTHAMEIDIVEFGTALLTTPYNLGAVGVSTGLWIASGGGQAGALDAGVALGIVTNTKKFLQGLAFDAAAIVDNGSGMPAVVMGKSQKFTWHSSLVSGEVARVRSEATAASLEMQFIDGAIAFNTLGGTEVFAFLDTGRLRVPTRLNIHTPVINFTNMTTATTVGAAGAANALPATPETYMVVEINGTSLKIPAYKV